MSLNANGRLLALAPLRYRGGSTLSFEVFDSNSTAMRNIYASYNTNISKSSAVPNGADVSNGVWVLPQSGGGISAYTTILGTGDFVGSGALGLNALASLVGVGDLTALGQLVVSAAATLAGSGDFTGNVVALLNTSANLAGSGDLQGALIALGNAVTLMQGTSTLSMTPYATGKLEADITPFTDLSPENLANAVWNSVALEGNYTAKELLRIIAAINAGKTDITGTVATFRSVNDTKDRVTATMTGSERTTIVVDVTD